MPQREFNIKSAQSRGQSPVRKIIKTEAIDIKGKILIVQKERDAHLLNDFERLSSLSKTAYSRTSVHVITI